MSIDLFSIAAKTDAALVEDITVIAKKAPKKKIILYFGPAEFFDNSKYLYLYGSENIENYKHIYCTLNETLATTLNERGLQAVNIQANWQKTIGLFLSAEIAVFCTNPSDAIKSRILLAALSGAYRVQLWHGVGLKSIELMNLGNRDFSDLAALYRTRSVLEFDTILSPAPMWDKHWFSVFGATNFLRANYPRNAVLKRPPTELELINAPKLELATSGNVLLAPTWEATGKQHWENNIDQLDELAKANGLKIFIKPHPFEKVKGPVAQQIEKLDYINLLPPLSDIYPVLNKFDFLITDHSSISFDVLQTDVSIIFLAPPNTFIGPSAQNNQRYDKSKLLFDFGPEVSSFYGLKDFSGLSNNADRVRNERRAFLSAYFENTPESACAMIFNQINDAGSVKAN